MVVQFACRGHQILQHNYWGVVSQCEPLWLEVAKGQVLNIFLHFVDSADECCIENLAL